MLVCVLSSTPTFFLSQKCKDLLQHYSCHGKPPSLEDRGYLILDLSLQNCDSKLPYSISSFVWWCFLPTLLSKTGLPHSYLHNVGYIFWPFGFEDDSYGARDENHDQWYHNAFIGHLILQAAIVDPFGVDIQEERHHSQGTEGGAGGHHDAGWERWEEWREFINRQWNVGYVPSTVLTAL